MMHMLLLLASPVCSGSDSMFLMALTFLGSVTRPEGVSETWNSAAAAAAAATAAAAAAA
jgi:hypothetical protein